MMISLAVKARCYGFLSDPLTPRELISAKISAWLFKVDRDRRSRSQRSLLLRMGSKTSLLELWNNESRSNYGWSFCHITFMIINIVRVLWLAFLSISFGSSSVLHQASPHSLRCVLLPVAKRQLHYSHSRRLDYIFFSSFSLAAALFFSFFRLCFFFVAVIISLIKNSLERRHSAQTQVPTSYGNIYVRRAAMFLADDC